MYPEISDRAAVKAAKAVCLGGCMVKSECLEDAIVNHDLVSIRAATTPSQRRRIRREWNAARSD